MKEAPGALRDLTATRTIAMLTDPLLLRRGPADPARFDEAEDFLLRVRSTLHLEAGRNQNVAQPRDAGADRGPARLPGRRAAPAGRAADERLLPPRAHRQPIARLGEQDRAGAGRARISGSRATAFASWIRSRRRAIRRRGLARSRRRSMPAPRWRRRRCRASSSTSTAIAPTTSFPRRRSCGAASPSCKPRPGLYARLSEMHDCGLLGRVFPEFQAISWRVVRDFYHKYTVDEHTLLTIRNLERLAHTDEPYRLRFRNVLASAEPARAAGAGAAAARRRQVARRRPRARERADGRGRRSIACSSPARRARRCCS